MSRYLGITLINFQEIPYIDIKDFIHINDIIFLHDISDNDLSIIRNMKDIKIIFLIRNPFDTIISIKNDLNFKILDNRLLLSKILKDFKRYQEVADITIKYENLRNNYKDIIIKKVFPLIDFKEEDIFLETSEEDLKDLVYSDYLLYDAGKNRSNKVRTKIGDWKNNKELVDISTDYSDLLKDMGY